MLQMTLEILIYYLANVGINDNGVAQLTKSHNELVLQRDRILRNSSEKTQLLLI